MLHFLPAFIKIPLGFSLVILNTVLWFVPLFVVAMFKLAVPLRGWRRACQRVMVWLAEHWISVNNLVTDLVQRVEWDVELPAELDRRGSYLVIANHQGWMDIMVLQRVFNRRIPFLTFFLKQQLIWVPLLGVAWWALDFPFMRRYSAQYLQRNPDKRGADLEVTRKACEKFRGMPVSIMSFVEGTRFREDKHDRQASPYRHLLKPRAGGIGFTLNAMNGTIRKLLDVTIIYHPHRAGLLDLAAGRVKKIVVRARLLDVPERFLQGDYQSDATWRRNFQEWLREVWAEKDRRIDTLLADG